MQDNDLIEIKISRIIPAKKWRVIRLLTKVEDFPSFVPTVKEASVIKKLRNSITTQWLIKVDTVPVRWTEEDTILLDQNMIQFKAIEGDMQEFRGTWQFSDHPMGTEVTVTIFLKITIPIIKDFAQDYLKKIVTKNFEAILEALEQRLVSVKYASYKKGVVEKIAGFGIIGHFYNLKHFEAYFAAKNPNARIPSHEFIGQLFHILPSFKAYDIVQFTSKTGQTVNGCFILATFFPDMMEKDIWIVFSKVVKACKIAEKHGMGIVGLGGFSALIGERIGHTVASEVDIPVTTGRTFTAGIVLEAVMKAALAMGRDLAASKVAIVGGSGDIGSAVARVLVGKAKQITLTGNTKANLSKIVSELKKHHRAQIIATLNNKDAVKDADIVIACASTSCSFLEISWFKPGAIICDVGYPKNVSYLSAPRDDIFLFDGGLAQSPTPLNLPINVGLPSPDLIYGCFAESIILDLEKRYEDFSVRRGSIMPDKIEEILALGKKHGFEASDFYWNGSVVDPGKIEKVKAVFNAHP